jgi:oxygen-independent coproporphyrinogen-3 oxidase
MEAVATGTTAVEVESRLDPSSLPFEFMLNALRLIEGVSASLFIERTGLWPTALGPVVQRACDQGLMTQDPTRYQATALGLRFLNDLQQRFLETEHGRVRQPSPPGT